MDATKEIKLEEQLSKKSCNMKLRLNVGLVMGIIYLLTVANAEMSFLEDQITENEECDLSSGKWILDASPPPYANANTSCKFVPVDWNCMKNGRPDTEYLHWRWKPNHCNLPPFDPKKFLNAMRDKSLAMIGDSIMRNQLQSLLCLLSEVEDSNTYYRKAYNFMRWRFHSYNFTLANYWTPFILQADFSTKRTVNLHLDKLDTEWTTNYHNYDYIVLAAGPWFSTPTTIMENNTVVGCHICNGKFKELGSFYPYRRALQMAFNFIVTSRHKPVILFRTWSPTHIEYRKGFKGGFCNRTVPYNEGEHRDTPTGQGNYAIDIEEFNKAASIGSMNGTRLKLLDIYHLSLLRPDGHPGPYMHFHPFDKDKDAQVENDCGHWCLPGPIDTWNYFMMKMVLNEGYTSLNDVY